MDNILIVDDNEVDVLAVKRALKDSGFELFYATDGDEAREICGTHPISVALVDYKLEHETGVEVFNQLVAQWPFMRGIMITSYLDFGLLTQVVETRFDDLLEKPLAGDALHDSIMKSLQNVIHWQARFREHKKSVMSSLLLEQYGDYIEIVNNNIFNLNADKIITDNILKEMSICNWQESIYLCVDFSSLKKIHSTSIGELISLQRSARQAGGDLGVYGAPDFIRQILKSLQLYDILHCSPDQEQTQQKMLANSGLN